MASEERERPILLAGAVQGRISELGKAVERAEAKAGQFEAVFAVGSFFPKGDAEQREWQDVHRVKAGERLVRPPVYFLDAMPEGAALAPSPGGESGIAQFANGLNWLRGGSVEGINGLTVGWVSGSYDPLSWEDKSTTARWAARRAGECRPEDLETTESEVQAKQPPYADITLTSEWPEKVANGDPSPPECDRRESSAARRAWEVTLPRYHVAPGGDFYNKSPFPSGKGHATRFVSLAPVSSGKKFLHALKLVPASERKPSPPASMAPCPFSLPDGGREQGDSGATKRKRDGGEGQEEKKRKIFLGNIPFSAKEGDIAEALEATLGARASKVLRGMKDDGKPAGYAFAVVSPQEADAAVSVGTFRMHDRDVRVSHARKEEKAHVKRKRTPPEIPAEAVSGCWFCLENGKDTHLVASVGTEAYLAADKAQLVEHHALCLPIAHAPSFASLPAQTLSEVWSYVCALSECFWRELGKRMIAFERHLTLRNKGGNHCHVNCLPCSPASADSAPSIIREEAAKRDISMVDLGRCAASSGPEGARGLQSALVEAAGFGEYFVAILPGGRCLAHVVGPGDRHPVGFGREAFGRILGQESRADWKSCVASDNSEEEESSRRLRSLFQPYDPLMPPASQGDVDE